MDYYGGNGLRRLAERFRGDENFCLGIRPFGFHAGNMAACVAYPILLAEELEKQGKMPTFSLTCFLNDYEQHRVTGHASCPDDDDENNIYPLDATMQFTYPDSGQQSVVDIWESVIRRNLDAVSQRFPGVSVTVRRSSEIKESALFADTLRAGLNNADQIADICEDLTGVRVLRPAEYARVVCPDCHTPVAKTRMKGDKIDTRCPPCDRPIHGTYTDFDYWMNHKLLGIAKLAPEDNYVLWFTGSDHKKYRTDAIRRAIMERFNLLAKPCDRVYAPLLVREDGQKMGKSNHNTADIDLDVLLDTLRGNDAESIVVRDSVLVASARPERYVR